MTLFKKSQICSHHLCDFIVQWLLLSLKNLSLLEQFGRKISCWSAGVLYVKKLVNFRSYSRGFSSYSRASDFTTVKLEPKYRVFFRGFQNEIGAHFVEHISSFFGFFRSYSLGFSSKFNGFKCFFSAFRSYSSDC